jgi:hypothetical protein
MLFDDLFDAADFTAQHTGANEAPNVFELSHVNSWHLLSSPFAEIESFSHPKKPARILLHNTNLLYALLNDTPREQDIMETFFTNSVWRHHTVESGQKPGIFIVNNHKICVCNKTDKRRKDNDLLYARYNCEVSHNGDIPIWLFGFIF